MSHPIDAIPEKLSLEVCAALVKAGMRAPWRNGVNQGDPPVYTLDVLGASNTTPIVITVPPNSLTVSDAAIGVRAPTTGWEGRIIHVVIAGVTGNTAANKLDEKPQRNEAWCGVVTSPTTIALYDLDNTGALVPSVGNGAYTGGGTVSRALIDGRILVGRKHADGEHASPPRIVMVPASVATEEPGLSTGGTYTQEALSAGERDAARVAPPLRTLVLTWEVHAWGTAGDAFGPTLLLVEALERAAYVKIGSSCWEAGRATWNDQHPDAPLRTAIGHWLVGTLTVRIPLTRTAVELAADDLDPLLTMSLGDGIGSPEAA